MYPQFGLLLLSSLALASPPSPHHGARDVLKYGTPESVGMLSKPLKDMEANVSGYTIPAIYGSFSHYVVAPIEPGSVTLVAHDNTIISQFAVGKRNLYADVNGTHLPARLQEDATIDTVYDMASLTKLFTTIAAMQQLDTGKLKLNATVATYMPEFAVNGKKDITLLQLLTHTSGFDADPVPSLCSPDYETQAQRVNAVITQAIINAPGSAYMYSDLNLMTMQLVLERVTHKPLDQLIRDFTSKLGMTSTFFNRNNVKRAEYRRMATQEFQIDVLGAEEPQRPQPVRGTVHDENAFCLGGVSGHAGIFSTVSDTAKLCQMILNNGTYGGVRYLQAKTVDLIFYNFNERFPGNEHGLGFELNQNYIAGPMHSLLTAAHTGFTGPSVVIDRGSNSFWLHFSNRVHASRTWSSNNIVREAIGYWIAKSLGRDVVYPPI